MTATRDVQRKYLIKLIHIGKNKLGMDNDTYKAFLMTVTNKYSCKDMGLIELNKVLTEMKKRGLKVSVVAPGKRRIAHSSTPVRSNIIKKIRAKWLEMANAGIVRDSSETALNTFVSKIARDQNGQPIHFVSWLDNTQASIVLERLKKWQQRTAKEV